MAVRTVTYRGFGLALRIPDGLPAALRARARRSALADAPPGVALRSPPPIFSRGRDPRRATSFVSAFYDDGASDPLPDPATLAAMPLADQVAATRWYHTIELPGGVVTPGAFDHRPLVAHYDLPPSLAGRRCLDAACSNGFWALELERRGGTVVALDIPSIADWDFPAGAPPLAASTPDARPRRRSTSRVGRWARRCSSCAATSTRWTPPTSARLTSSTWPTCCCTCATRSTCCGVCER